MRVNCLQLQNFRNYDTLEQPFNKQVIIFRGANAQGKTNVLEALYMLALGKSHRTSRDRDCMRWGSSYAVIKAEIERDDGRHRLQVQLSNKGKKVKRNGLEQRRLSDYIGTLNAVMFAPEDLAIVKGKPEVRRRCLDMGISQVNPTYLYHLSRYYKILSQRNRLLKDLWRQPSAATLLEVLNEQLIAAGTQVILKRNEFIHKIEGWAQTIQAQLTNEREQLQLTYRTFINDMKECEEDTVPAQYREQLNQRAQQEQERGTTMIGPHRDDMTFAVNGVNVQVYGSQGQQRTTALALKLAEIELICQEVGEYPILLLDDVLSELDETRQTHLIRSIQEKVQTFMTTTSTDGIHQETLAAAAVYDVEQGRMR